MSTKMTDDITTRLKAIFNNPSTGLGSAETLYREAKKQGLVVTKKQVNDAYKSFHTAQVFHPVEHQFFSFEAHVLSFVAKLTCSTSATKHRVRIKA